MTTAEAAHQDPRDRQEIADLVSRMFRSYDQRELDEEATARFIADDVHLTTPVGAARGRAEVARLNAEALGRFDRTQHQATDLLVEVAPDGATARAGWNALMTHAHHASTLRERRPDANPLFVVGGYWRGTLVRTAGGWRFDSLAIEPIWHTGDPPPLG
ncbi:nuclear transport factor 2 family protein [Streptomyces profundus]|uniref:nuclear transport factor 2 family protein n=1 Tax=Streptomyces profundus TaxID=2867410 RepID=UPI001D165109|nr:nuclear transport factor 2 family protein [Streptomyces sp. MA3_2.13]UED83750.1 nuclear transport factor 2 family protein [Streptomyces sp. MA3_2.13]